MTNSDNHIEKVILQLCLQVSGLNKDQIGKLYTNILEQIQKSQQLVSDTNEIQVVERIKKKFVRKSKTREASNFQDFYRKLRNEQTSIKNRGSLLCFLECLSRLSESTHSQKFHFSSGVLSRPTSTPNQNPNLFKTPASVNQHQIHSTLSSGISSIAGRTNETTPTPRSHPPSYWRTPAAQQFHGQNPTFQYRSGSDHYATQQLTFGTTPGNSSSKAAGDPYWGSKSEETAGKPQIERPNKKDRDSSTISEAALIKDLIYNLQGIDGKYIKFDVNAAAFRPSKVADISTSRKDILSKISECGWLYMKVRKYTDLRSLEKSFGLVGQCFCAALNNELTEFYHLVAVLDSQALQDEDQGVTIGEGVLTLRRLLLWSYEPLVRLRSLAALVDVCQGKKGGSLASIIYSYSQHGDVTIKCLMEYLLMKVVQPIFVTIIRWIYEGELQDSYNEFFVSSDPTVKEDKLWHEKYSLRKSMIPSFIPMEQAQKILLTGKSINFLHHVCHDETNVRELEAVKLAETHQVETIFRQDSNQIFHRMVETVYEETSTALLEVLQKRYKFLDHLQALRRYLLLGQGDFIRHLMDLLHDDLSKSATSLYLHNLSGVLETAIRGTNAQFDDSDILKRLDVRLLEVSGNEVGWDVFSLDYRVDGPISTVFTPECMIIYLRIFNFLWRAKRMEYALSAIWREQVANARLLRNMPELTEILHNSHMLCSQMIHFVQQMQYYINFEVLECSWELLLLKVNEAKDLDHVIAAHQEFLDTITCRCLLDVESSKILAELRAIFDQIIIFQLSQRKFFELTKHELHLRELFDENMKKRTAQNEWGITEAEEEAEMNRRKEFIEKEVKVSSSAVIVLANSYRLMVGGFLSELASHSDQGLTYLSFRLNFNEHYNLKEVENLISKTER